jgi:hypothetical protein
MKGLLTKTDEGWQVSHATYDIAIEKWTAGKLPLHPDDVKQIQEDSQIFDNIDARISAHPNVEFKIVEVFNKNGQIGHRYINYAKLIDEKEKCEYSGLPSVDSYDSGSAE